MIQLIQYNDQNKVDNVDVSSLSSPISLDEYDINIIDLSDSDIWKNNSDSFASINMRNDFISLGIMLSNSIKAKNIIILPQDQLFYYNYKAAERYGHKRYYKSIRLKDMLDYMKNEILKKLINLEYDLIYESTNTKIMDKTIKSSFYFKALPKNKAKTTSLGSEKATTFLLKENQLVTTLELNSEEKIKLFLEFLGLTNNKEETPDWIHEIEFYDDKEQKEKINKSKEEIKHLKEVIETSNKKIVENLEYKSILYSNGDELVEVVFDMLETMLNYDLNSFVDEKNEDFIIKLEDITFVGEIKGVNSNIKSTHISQLEIHYQGYLDKLHEIGETEEVKSLIIITHQRNTPSNERKKIHDIQINLAKRNGSLIIESETLLRYFERFKKNELSTENFKELLRNNTGLLSI